MIAIPRTVRVWAHRAPVDLRKGYNGLVGIVKQRRGRDVLDGDLFLVYTRFSASALSFLAMKISGRNPFARVFAQLRCATYFRQQQPRSP